MRRFRSDIFGSILAVVFVTQAPWLRCGTMQGAVLRAQYSPSSNVNGPASIKDGSTGMDIFQDTVANDGDETLDDDAQLEAEQARQDQADQQQYDLLQQQMPQQQHQLDPINQPEFQQQQEQQFNQQQKPLP